MLLIGECNQVFEFIDHITSSRLNCRPIILATPADLDQCAIASRPVLEMVPRTRLMVGRWSTCWLIVSFPLVKGAP
jgi:hypothetical protein